MLATDVCDFFTGTEGNGDLRIFLARGGEGRGFGRAWSAEDAVGGLKGETAGAESDGVDSADSAGGSGAGTGTANDAISGATERVGDELSCGKEDNNVGGLEDNNDDELTLERLDDNTDGEESNAEDISS